VVVVVVVMMMVMMMQWGCDVTIQGVVATSFYMVAVCIYSTMNCPHIPYTAPRRSSASRRQFNTPLYTISYKLVEFLDQELISYHSYSLVLAVGAICSKRPNTPSFQIASG